MSRRRGRRERLLYLTARGKALADRLAAPQLVRLREALGAAGPDAEAAIRRFLEAMINAEDRPKVSAITNPTLHQTINTNKGEKA